MKAMAYTLLTCLSFFTTVAGAQTIEQIEAAVSIPSNNS